MSAIAEATGTVVSFDFEPGAGTPELVLDTDTEQISLIVSPYRLVAASGLQLEPDMEVSVIYAPATVDEVTHLVTISITDLASGVTVQLRDPETGFPLMSGRGHHHRGGR
jgi:Iap family predicted aminopeptidase